MSMESVNKNIIRLIEGLDAIVDELRKAPQSMPSDADADELSKMNKTLRSIDRSLKKIAEKMPSA
ncbi:MAG: hypothetical protein H8E17_02055 [Deltaproteobacteria bacterium]|nr:hypothetical protein [Deltaproteobacteria bacterium]